MASDRRGNTDGAVDRIIHEPSRYKIMALLYVVDNADFLFLQNQLELTPGNLSSHISKLEKVSYVKVEKRFEGKIPRTILSLTETGRVEFEQYRKTMIQMLGKLPDIS